MDMRKTDPEFAERFEHFAFEEAVKEGGQLPEEKRYLAILAALIGCGGVDAYEEVLPKAMENGVTPVMVKECVYQATDYLGYGRMLPFLRVTNAVLDREGVALPLPGQATTTMEDRLERGVAAQGGCEPQLTAHARGNLRLGNDSDFLTRVVLQCLPYIGYPRSLNAIACIHKAAEE